MKDYQQKKLKAYVLPQPVYRQALWAVKDMQRLKTRLAELKADAYVLGGRDYGMPVSGYGTGCLCDSTGSSAIKIAHVEGRIDAIEQALMAVPSEYRDGIRDKGTKTSVLSRLSDCYLLYQAKIIRFEIISSPGTGSRRPCPPRCRRGTRGARRWR